MDKRNFFIIGIVLFVFFFCLSGFAQAAQRILLAGYIETPDYAVTREAFRTGLDQASKQQGLDIEWVELLAVDNKQEFIRRIKELENSIDMIFVAGTPNALAIKQAGVKKPVLFAAVANPKKAKLVNNFHGPETNFTGSYCSVSVNRQLQTILCVLPNIKNIAVIFNQSDPAPAAQVEEWARAVGFLKNPQILLKKILIPENIASAQDMLDFMNTTDKNIDVLITTADSKISNYGTGIIDFARQYKIPTYAGLNSMVEQGALLSLGFKFKQAALEISVPQAVKILKGVLPQDIPVGTLPEYSLAINLKTAQEIGFVFPEKVVESADVIIK